ncbi:nucleotidyl transferase AbiEii/AbiGii toxin family protein [Desulfurobacterium sp.]
MNLKLATIQEIEFYEKILYPVQDEVLDAVGKIFGDAFYLTGGTATSRFYFQHRLSEDLDLFTEKESIKTAVPRIVKTIESLGYEVLVKSMSVTFGRLFVNLEGGKKLKIDLAADYPIEKPKPVKNFYVDTITNVAVNKITAFEDRAELKDLIDLYYIVKEGNIDLEKILELADRKRVPVPYENLLAINSVGLTGSVLLLKEVEVKNLENFLKELKEVLEENVKKKVRESREKIEEIVQNLLWDFPFEERNLSKESLPVLKRRMQKLPYPERIALQSAFNLIKDRKHIDLEGYTESN